MARPAATRTVPAAWAGKRIFLQFDGANRSAEVFLNGHWLGRHRGGFARFRFDATSAVDPNGSNVLAVRVRQTDEEGGLLSTGQALTMATAADLTALDAPTRPFSFQGQIPIPATDTGIAADLSAELGPGRTLTYAGLLKILEDAASGKVLLERSNAHQLDACQKQLGVFQLQVQQAKTDRDTLDSQLPQGAGRVLGFDAHEKKSLPLTGD